jgi:hypothetical protein
MSKLVHIRNAIEAFLAELARELEEQIEARGGFRGPICPAQRPWSDALDLVESEGQGETR